MRAVPMQNDGLRLIISKRSAKNRLTRLIKYVMTKPHK